MQKIHNLLHRNINLLMFTQDPCSGSVNVKDLDAKHPRKEVCVC